MAAELAAQLQRIVAMLSSVWAVLPVALAVVLTTWVWFNRARRQDSPEEAGLQSASPDTDRDRVKSCPKDRGSRPEGVESWQDDRADKATPAEKGNAPEIKGTELRVGVQQSPVKQNATALGAKDISDTVVKNLRETDFGPAVSNNQDLPDSRQTQNFCESKEFVCGAQSVHNVSITEEYNSGDEKVYVCETMKSTISVENVYEKSDHKDEAFDLDSALNQKFSETGCLNDGGVTDTISESNADMPNELKSIKTEMERIIFEEQVNAESERTNVNSEPENISRKVAAVSPLPLNNVSVHFNVHYLTCSNSQILAVTGSHECLGQWETYVPLKPNKDRFWYNSILVPVNSRIEWKYVMVENGKIQRWEECLNRCLVTGHEDLEIHQCWGYH
uniref:uncharacterized protein stbd1 n=1 Tax=Pristiophorus japonicus TaxID=55135 RepID=UPI00398E8F5A